MWGDSPRLVDFGPKTQENMTKRELKALEAVGRRWHPSDWLEIVLPPMRGIWKDGYDYYMKTVMAQMESPVHFAHIVACGYDFKEDLEMFRIWCGITMFLQGSPRPDGDDSSLYGIGWDMAYWCLPVDWVKENWEVSYSYRMM